MRLLVVLLIYSLGHVVQAQTECPNQEELPPFDACWATFLGYFTEEFYDILCSESGRAIANCLVQYASVCPGVWDLVIREVDNIRLSVFKPELEVIDVTCELKLKPVCREAQDCFLAIFGESSSQNSKTYSGLAEFFQWFCGAENLVSIATCFRPAAGECPSTIYRLNNINVLFLADGSPISYFLLQQYSAEQCSNIESIEDTTTCLTDNADDLLSCARAQIRISDRFLSCNYLNNMETCIAGICRQDIAQFFVRMFDFLECSRQAQQCSGFTDDNLVQWPDTLGNTITRISCPDGVAGYMQRSCSTEGEWGPLEVACQFATTTEATEAPDDGTTVLSIAEDTLIGILNGSRDPDVLIDVLRNLTDYVSDEDNRPLSEDDLVKLTELTNLVVIVMETKKDPTSDEAESFLDLINNLMHPLNVKPWQVVIEDEDFGADVLFLQVERMIRRLMVTVCSSPVTENQQNFTFSNVYNKVQNTVEKNVNFPDRTKPLKPWLQNSRNQLSVSEDAFAGLPALCYGGSYYRSVEELIPHRLLNNGTIQDVAGQRVVNTAVLGMLLKERRSTPIDPPVEIVFELLDSSEALIDPECYFWDYNAGDSGAWSADGCTLVSYNKSLVVCQCNHLTNFCVLMSPWGGSGVHTKALSIISAVGCGISILCLLVTVIMYRYLWRYVKSDRAIILMNLCGALLAALIFFLAGVNRTESKDACTAVAAILHFLFLVVFFLMLLQGIEILISVVHVFVTKFRIKVLLPLFWLIPAVIVGVSMGVTKLEGYGNTSFCWLSVHNNLIWAFVGPAAFVILVNLIVIIVIFYKMATSTIMKGKSTKVKAKTGLRSLCVLLPLLGLTWAFGLLSVNEGTILFQYLFAIFNSLQGLFIFLTHCIFNKQIQDAIRAVRARRKTRSSIESDFRRKSKSESDRRSSDPRNRTSATDDLPDPRRQQDRRGGSLAEDSDPGGWEREMRKDYHRNIRKSYNQ